MCTIVNQFEKLISGGEFQPENIVDIGTIHIETRSINTYNSRAVFTYTYMLIYSKIECYIILSCLLKYSWFQLTNWQTKNGQSQIVSRKFKHLNRRMNMVVCTLKRKKNFAEKNFITTNGSGNIGYQVSTGGIQN